MDQSGPYYDNFRIANTVWRGPRIFQKFKPGPAQRVTFSKFQTRFGPSEFRIFNLSPAKTGPARDCFLPSAPSMTAKHPDVRTRTERNGTPNCDIFGQER